MGLFRRKVEDTPPEQVEPSVSWPDGHAQLPPLDQVLNRPLFQPPHEGPPADGGGVETLVAEQRQTRPPRFSAKFRFVAYSLFICIFGSAALLGGSLIYFSMIFPHPLSLEHRHKAPVIRILARDGSVMAQRGSAHEHLPLSMLPQHMIDAVIATEDRRFFEHWGVDPAGLLRATFANLRAGRFAQGGSTITQQLAKNLFLSRERTLTRKIEEVALAVWLEARLTKRQILTLYLNRVYFGSGAYGVEAAAQRYFDKSARALTIAEAAIVAGLLKAPSRYSPLTSPVAARRRGRSVLFKMLRAKVLSKKKFDLALNEPIRFVKRNRSKHENIASYAVDYVLAKMPQLITGNHKEIVVETTFDADLQSVAKKTVSKVLRDKGNSVRANQAALVVLDTAGAIRAMVGGRSYLSSQFNRAVNARRQPGSTFKPFVYLTALENGMVPDSVTYDLPIKVDNWTPRNGTRTYKGAVTLRHALANSINSVAIRLNVDFGAGKVADTARRLGIRSNLRESPSLALGTSEVSLMELTRAYGVFANGGYQVKPYMIRRVKSSDGRVLYAHAGQTPDQLISERHAGYMNDMLNAALEHGTGRRARLRKHMAAGKTGTSQQFRDAWFVGYSAHVVAGVWVGNDNGRTMDRVSGGTLPAEIWNKVMAHAHVSKAPLRLPGTRWLRRPKTSAPAAVARRRAPQVKAARRKAVVTRKVTPQKKQAARAVRVPKGRISEDFYAKALSGLQRVEQPSRRQLRNPPRRLAQPNATQPAIPRFEPRSTPKAPVLARRPAQAGRPVDAIARQIEMLDQQGGATQLARTPRPRPAGMMTLGVGQR